MGYFDAAAFWQEYENTIEFTYAAWEKLKDRWGDDSLVAGFKYINTGKTRVQGMEMSLNGEGKISDKMKIDIIGGYTYVKPIALEPRVFTPNHL